MLSIEMRMTFASLGGADAALGADADGAALADATAFGAAGALAGGAAAAAAVDVAGVGSGFGGVREHADIESRAKPNPP
jgi:hypothetical protein